MKKKNIYIGEIPAKANKQKVSGKYIERDGETYYRISNFDQMPPFFMSLVSHSDHWMFISSNGGLAAGRKNAENALFPYYTDDKIHDANDHTGSKTILLVEKNNDLFLWEPLSLRQQGIYMVKRNILKNIPGNKIIFEEINYDLGVAFNYTWLFSEKFGIVKKSAIHIKNSGKCVINILDGIQNVLPYGVKQTMQTNFSTLMDAYKKSELINDSGLALFRLSSIPVDRAEPSEALKVTTVWSSVPGKRQILLSSQQLDDFRKGRKIQTEFDMRATRGAYFINTTIKLKKDDHKEWYIVSEINCDASKVAVLQDLLRDKKSLTNKLEKDIADGTRALLKTVAVADGIQITGDHLSASRHFSNVLFNIMRGGIFKDAYNIDKEDLISFIASANKSLLTKIKSFMSALPDPIQYSDLISRVNKTKNKNLIRLCYEYLPLTFSRRHGDPSRPWNVFSINTRDEQGNKVLDYEGNWRDIFQNWEALVTSFPGYIESMICKFVNASTMDGYNPYRITRDGFEWEDFDPSDPWSYIGYWGDHQIIYLLKFLELSQKYHPGLLKEFLTKDLFVYANTPYRIKPYEQLVANPQDTIQYDFELAEALKRRKTNTGSDGTLVQDKNGRIFYVNLTEKLLVSLLAKFSNFIPEAGIWMNTQRPEWNDANNALVGSGVSMVTLYHIRRYLEFCRELFKTVNVNSISLSSKLAELLSSIYDTFNTHLSSEMDPISDTGRKQILDLLGSAGSDYREHVYEHSLAGKKVRIQISQLNRFFNISFEMINRSIHANKRPDGLYHAYNLIKFSPDEKIEIRYLYEMLEGQVAVLSSGYLSDEESVSLLDTLKKSALFRKDQHSYLLYPDRDLLRFIEKNIIPPALFKKSRLLQILAKDQQQDIITKDISGTWHFNGSFRNSAMLANVLNSLGEKQYKNLIKKELPLILEIYEEIFDHQSFTGRSGTFFGYEGLGCIYWHMVSKLLLAVGEIVYRAQLENADPKIVQHLVQHFYDIREGIGVHKSPELYGAFPTDPYSHTPANAGAQQPGMTGQVKEDFLARLLQLGVIVTQGEIHFSPVLLKREEFLDKPGILEFYDYKKHPRILKLKRNSLAFTFCQTPVIYYIADRIKLKIYDRKNKVIETTDTFISHEKCNQIFNRTGEIQKVEVFWRKDQIT